VIRAVRRPILFALAATVLCAPVLAAQEPQVLNGRVMAGLNAVPNQPVSLHRVTGSGGNTLATDTTDADGRFVLPIGPPAPGDGVLFVATRFEGKLYIGDTFRGDPPPGYALRVGPGATPIELGTTASAPTPPARPEPNRAGIAVLIVSAILLGGIFFLAARRRSVSGRQLLVEIADLDNRNEVTALPSYSQQRAELLRRLRESA
jgi:hypothetical protein